MIFYFFRDFFFVIHSSSPFLSLSFNMSSPKHVRTEPPSPCTAKRVRTQHVYTISCALDDQDDVEVLVCGDEQAFERVLSDCIFRVLESLHFFTALTDELSRPLSINLHEDGGEGVTWCLEQIADNLEQVFSIDTIGGVSEITREEVDFKQLVPLLQRLKSKAKIEKSDFSAAELKMVWDNIASSQDNAAWLHGAWISSKRTKVEFGT